MFWWWEHMCPEAKLIFRIKNVCPWISGPCFELHPSKEAEGILVNLTRMSSFYRRQYLEKKQCMLYIYSFARWSL
jgi:hypothetical protein